MHECDGNRIVHPGLLLDSRFLESPIQIDSPPSMHGIRTRLHRAPKHNAPLSPQAPSLSRQSTDGARATR